MFSKFFINRPRFAMVISITLILIGLLSIGQLPIAEYPEIAPPQIQIEASYTGASSRVVAETVALPIESEINGVENLLYFSSTCNDLGGYACTITFKSGTDSDIAMVNVQNAIKRAEVKLPDEVKLDGISVAKETDDMLSVFVFMAEEGTLSTIELNNYINTVVKDAISRIDGVSSATVLSTQDYSMRVWLDPMRVSGLGLSTDEIGNAIRAQNIQAAAGTIGSESGNDYVQYKINVQGRLKTIEEFGDIVLRTDDANNILRLKDVARIELGASMYSGTALWAGKDAVAMAIFRNADANALSTVNAVKEMVLKQSERFPEGVAYDVVYDPTEFIVISMKEIVETLVIALLLVVGITYVFLQDWRATLIPAIAIPVSLLATFPVMLVLGYSINVLTMFGLILVIGSLVDDAIVVVENTQVLMEREGLSAREAALKSMTQITGAVVATTLVTLACYVPLAFYGGMVGTIYLQFAVTMCIALCFSTLVALTLSPALCSLILRKPPEQAPKVFRPFNHLLDKTKGVYLFGVKILVRRAALTLALLGGVFLSVYLLGSRIPESFLPEEDKGAIFCNIELPAGATLARTDAAVKEFREIVAGIDGLQGCLTVSGMSLLSGDGENYATAIIRLNDWDDRKTPELQLNALIDEISERTRIIPSAQIMAFTPPPISGLGVAGGLSFMISGEGDVSPIELAEAATRMSFEISANPEFMYAVSLYNADTPQLYLDIDREKAELLGTPTSRIYSTLQAKLASFYVNDFNLLGDTFKVKMQSETDNRATLEDIMEIQIANNFGKMVPLSSLGDLSYIVGPRRIQRFNKMTSAEIMAQGIPGMSSGVLMDIVEKTRLPTQYHIEWIGLSYQEKANQGRIVFLMGLSFLFAYLFLVAQYESWWMPVPVMLSVTVAIAGALFGLWLTGSSLSIYAQLGLVMLVGLAAKSAILMAEFSKTERENEVSITDAAMNGASLRFRAVLMTAISFLFGVLPLMFATGAGSAGRVAIGITTFSGMLAATLIGIFFTPSLYAACQRWREWVKRKMGWIVESASTTIRRISGRFTSPRIKEEGK